MTKPDLFFDPHQNAGAQAIRLAPIASLASAPMGKLMPIFKTFFRLSHIEYLPAQSYLIPNVFLKSFACSSNLEKKLSLTTCVVNFIPG
jgi:hypothetical protein